MIMGAVLAGGGSTRFGSNKALALLASRPLMAHAIESISASCGEVVIVGQDFAGSRRIDDRPGPDLGPLAALNAALHDARSRCYTAVLTIACDTPQVPSETIARLIQAGDAAYVTATPVIGLWPVSLADALDGFIATTGRRSMLGWANHVGALGIIVPPVANINRPEDLAALESAWDEHER